MGTTQWIYYVEAQRKWPSERVQGLPRRSDRGPASAWANAWQRDPSTAQRQSTATNRTPGRKGAAPASLQRGLRGGRGKRQARQASRTAQQAEKKPRDPAPPHFLIVLCILLRLVLQEKKDARRQSGRALLEGNLRRCNENGARHGKRPIGHRRSSDDTQSVCFVRVSLDPATMYMPLLLWSGLNIVVLTGQEQTWDVRNSTEWNRTN